MKPFPPASLTLLPALALLWALFLAWPPASSAQSESSVTTGTAAASGTFAQQPEAANEPAPAVSDLAAPSAVSAPPALPPEAAPASAPAGPPKAAAPAPTGFAAYDGLDLFKALGAFVLVMLLLVLALKGLGRLGRFRGLKGRGSIFELRGVHALDNRKYLAAVAVEGRLLVVGVTPERITPVAQWILEPDDDQGLDFASLPGAPKGAGLDFELPEERPARPVRPAYERPEDLDISVADHHEGREK